MIKDIHPVWLGIDIDPIFLIGSTETLVSNGGGSSC